MRPIIYTDEQGLMHRTLIKDSDPDNMAEYGVHAGPPDLHQIDWETVIKELNNTLVLAGIFTWEDVQRKGPDFIGAVNTVKKHIINLYREHEREIKANSL